MITMLASMTSSRPLPGSKPEVVYIHPISTAQARFLLTTDDDFVCSKKHEYSLKKFLEMYPNGAPDRVTAASLMITEDEVEVMFKRIIAKMREHMGVDDPDSL